MPLSSVQIEKTRREALGTAVAAAALLILLGGANAFSQGRHGAWVAAAGGVIVVLRLVAPRSLLPVALPFSRAMDLVGRMIGTALLTVFYVVLVWPYALLLRRLGTVEPPVEPWPPIRESGWTDLDTHVPEQARAALPGGLFARAALRVGDAVALLRFFRSRPSWYLIPLLLILLVLGGLVLAGKALGLGPFVYTLF